MEWLEQNINAYRIVSEVLGQLRVAVREGLERVYGDEWYRKGLPQQVFDRLVAAKEREKSIDWYEDQYQQIMEYVTFPDLIEILQANAEHFPDFVSLAPSESLLHARFLELDVMRAKLGSARPISETELSFLATFHLRFRKAVEATQGRTPAIAGEPVAQSDAGEDLVIAAAATEQEPKEEPAGNGDVFVDAGADRKIAEIQPVQPPTQIENDERPLPPIRAVQTSVGSTETPIGSSAARADDPGDTPTTEDITPDGPAEGFGSAAVPEEISSGEIAAPDRAAKAIGPRKLQEALSTNDHLTVLRSIYREVTAIAEGVWSSEITPRALVWEQVTASDWYEVNFSRLGLQPLSVFYEVTEKVDKKIRSGVEKAELQEFLKETNFAKTLLAMRDMFQANNL